MWSLGPHCHSLLRGYCFLDPQWETDFQARCQQWAVVPMRMHALVSMVVSVIGVTDFARYFSLKAGLVLHLLLCVVMALLFTGTIFNSFVCRHGQQLLSFCCGATAICYSYILTEDAWVWGEYSLSHFLPNLMHLSADDAVREQVEEFIRHQKGAEAVYVALLWSFNHWVAIALLGWNRYTVCSSIVVYVSLSCAILLTPKVRVTDAMPSFAIATLATGGFLLVSIVMERLRRTSFLNEMLLTRELQASQMADSMLNHTLKNLLADVAATIEVFLAGAAPSSTLEDSVTCLRRGMMACKERQVYLKLVSGGYVPVSHPVNLKEFGQSLVAGRGIKADAMDLSVHLDSTICSLILENALSNALRHGHPQHPQVRLIIEALNAEPHTRHGYQRIRFTVENAADPARPPLTAEDVERIFQGQAQLVSDEQVPSLSDRVGIMHCVMAAQLGGFSLSLSQSGSIVQFSAIHDARIVTQPCVRNAFDWPGASAVKRFPSGLRFCCIDDSKPALRLLELHLQKWCSPSTIHLLGRCEDDVQHFVPFALQHADVAILDQRLEYSQTYFGTDLVRQLCEKGFQGLICIRSANDSVQDQDQFRRAGAHCCFGKDLLGSRMTEELKAAYVQLKGCPPSPVQSESPTLFRVESLSSPVASPANKWRQNPGSPFESPALA